ncbi:MAG: hypothetical protein HYU97_04700 [Deltaproteobacteria bacterium]|nr:hypothetical protein [Deltaproteobacteria bacterium]
MKGNTLKAFLAIVFLFSITSTSHAELNAWTELSPGDVGVIHSIVGGKMSLNVYAGTNKGVHKYIYAENRWEPLGLQDQTILEVGIINHVLYAANGKKLWHYDAAGKKWNELTLPASFEREEVIRSLSKSDDTLILGTNKGKVFVFREFGPNQAVWNSYDFEDETIVVSAIHQYDSKIIVIGTSRGLYAAIVGQSHPPMAIGGGVLPRDGVEDLIVFNNTLFVAYKTGVYAKTSDQSNFVKLSDGLEFDRAAPVVRGFTKQGESLYLLVRGGNDYPSRLFYLEGSSWKEFSPTIASTLNNTIMLYLTSTKDSLYIGNTSRIYEIHFPAQPEPPPPPPTPPVPTPPLDTDGDGVIDTT